jgi:hypothetical protein
VPDQRWEKLDRLEAAIAVARAALGASREEIERAADALHAAFTEAPDGTTRERGRTLWCELAEKVRSQRDARVRERLAPCARCRGVELLVAEPRTVTIAGAAIPYGLAVCARCGDVRAWCDDVAALRALVDAHGLPHFRAIVVAADSHGPFR